MPYRHAHWFVLALFPLAAMAFWRSYLSKFGAAEMAFHAHGISASMWLLLLAAQSWSIHNGSRAWHRSAGLLSLALFPLFLAGGASIYIGMAQRYVEGADPFYQLYAPRLAWLDIVGVAGIAYFFYQAMRLRRKVWLHSGYLLATAIFLLPPIIGRLAPLILGMEINGPADFGKLDTGFQFANVVTALIALGIGIRSRQGRPFFEAAALVALSAILYELLGGWSAWQSFFPQTALIPVGLFAIAAGVAGLLIGWAGWTAGRRPPHGAIAA